jgi:hypothetical protein
MSERVVDADEPFPRGGWYIGGTKGTQQQVELKALYDYLGKPDFGVVSIGPTSTQLTADDTVILAEAATSLAIHLNPNAFQSLDHVPTAEMAPDNFKARLESLMLAIGGRTDCHKSTEDLFTAFERGLCGYFREHNPKGTDIPALESLKSTFLELRKELKTDQDSLSLRLQAVQDRERERAVNAATSFDSLFKRLGSLEEAFEESSERQIATEKTLSEADYRSRCNSSRASSNELDIKYIKKALGATREAIEEMERPF